MEELSLEGLVGVGLRYGSGVGDKARQDHSFASTEPSAPWSSRCLLVPVSRTSRPHLERGATSSTNCSS